MQHARRLGGPDRDHFCVFVPAGTSPLCRIVVGREDLANAPLQLFGYEIVTIMCVDLWGVRIGFGLIAAGTLLGELATF